MLNPDLDRQELASRFAEDGRICIKDILADDVAERIRSCCLTDLDFDYLSHIDGRNIAIPTDALAKLGQAERRDMNNKAMAAAAEGVGFVYCGYQLVKAKAGAESEGLQFLHSVFDFLNSDEMLSFASEVTGRSDLKSADAQYTRYTPGQYLTRHRDDVGDEERRLAYVMGFTKNWHPDWGGLLQFYEDDGTPRDTWAPDFNVLSIFEIRHVHSVTYVTPFAKEPRLSLTGWFRAKTFDE